MKRSITVASLILTAACGGRLFRGGTVLSYAQYHSLRKGMRTGAVLKAFGPAREVLEREGTVRGLQYRCENANGDAVRLRLVFGPTGRLQKWALQENS